MLSHLSALEVALRSAHVARIQVDCLCENVHVRVHVCVCLENLVCLILSFEPEITLKY